MEFAPLVALAAMVFTFINFLRYLSKGSWNGAVTIAISWLAGVVGVFLVAQTDFASSIPLGDHTLASLNGWSLLFVGLTIASTGSALSDTISAIDHSRSSAKPHLLND